MVETFQAGEKPTFVEKLDAIEVAKNSGMPLAPVMIYGDDVTHVLTEESIAYLSQHATDCLIKEVNLTPTFYALAQQCWQRPVDIALRETVGRLGREGERQMMATTDGVNTHRGAIWELGLLVSAAAMQGGEASSDQLCTRAAELARLPDHHAPKTFSKGLYAVKQVIY